MLCWGLKNRNKAAASHCDAAKRRNPFPFHSSPLLLPQAQWMPMVPATRLESEQAPRNFQRGGRIAFTLNIRANTAHRRRQGACPTAVLSGEWICGPTTANPPSNPGSRGGGTVSRAGRPDPGARSKPLPERSPGTPLPWTPSRPRRPPSRPHALTPSASPGTHGHAPPSSHATPKAPSAAKAGDNDKAGSPH